MDFPSPSIPADSRTKVFLRYLDYFRSRVVGKLRELPPEELRSSRLPSGWSPLELLKHLRYMERRWLEWGFKGQPIPDPWGDQVDDRWVRGRRRHPGVAAGRPDRAGGAQPGDHRGA